MFSSFRVPNPATSRQSITPENRSRASTPASLVDARGHTLVACSLCRARKLKCSGDREACSRCRTSGNVCVYPQNARGSGGGAAGTAGKRRTRPASDSINRAPSNDESTPTSMSSALTSTPPPPPPLHHSSTEPSIGFDPKSHYFMSSHELEVPQDLSTNSLDASMPDFDEADLEAGLNLDDCGLIADKAMHSLDFDLGYDFCTLTTDTQNALPNDTRFALATSTPLSPRSGSELPAAVQRWSTDTTSAAGSSTSLLGSSISPQSSCGGTCLTATVQLLEDIGKQRSCIGGTGMDRLMKCIQTTTHACANVLSCTRCSVFTENAMLSATVVQQLGGVCTDIGELLLRCKADEEQCGAVVDYKESVMDSGLLKGNIIIGSYSIDSLQMRDALVRRLILCQLNDVCVLLTRIMNDIGRNGSGWRFIAETKEQVHKVLGLVQDLDASQISRVS